MSEKIDLDLLPDDQEFNRSLRIRSLPTSKAPQPGIGRIYYDITQKKLKIYVDNVGKWADLDFTTTSTSTTSTSTTTTSSSTSTTSTSTTSTSTTTTP